MKFKRWFGLMAAVAFVFSSMPAGARYYQVVSGDTLGEIGSRYGVSWQEIAEENGITDVRKLMPGVRLKIGGLSADGTTYKVTYGDTLGAIAAELGMDWRELAGINGISDPTRLMAGTVLTLNGSQGAAPAAEPETVPEQPAVAPPEVPDISGQEIPAENDLPEEDISEVPEQAADAVTEVVVQIPNEDRLIQATILVPAGEGPFPAVVMNHGHGGSREEGGGFTSLAEGLADAGILTIRMDFPGCGESTAPFTEFVLSNMISDSNACLAYILENCDVDDGRLGILGYSMGGRISLTIASEEDTPYKAAALLAPSADNGHEAAVNLLGGQESYDVYLDEAQSEKGYADFVTVYGQEQQLSARWFDEMSASEPLSGIENFQGAILVMYGDEDDVVSAAVNELVIEARPDAGKIVVPGADHGYGFYSDQPEVTAAVESGIIQFFADNL